MHHTKKDDREKSKFNFEKRFGTSKSSTDMYRKDVICLHEVFDAVKRLQRNEVWMHDVGDHSAEICHSSQNMHATPQKLNHFKNHMLTIGYCPFIMVLNFPSFIVFTVNFMSFILSDFINLLILFLHHFIVIVGKRHVD